MRASLCMHCSLGNIARNLAPGLDSIASDVSGILPPLHRTSMSTCDTSASRGPTNRDGGLRETQDKTYPTPTEAVKSRAQVWPRPTRCTGLRLSHLTFTKCLIPLPLFYLAESPLLLISQPHAHQRLAFAASMTSESRSLLGRPPKNLMMLRSTFCWLALSSMLITH